MCGNSTNCHTFTSQAVPSTGCFLQWLKLSASVCCKIEVSADTTVFRTLVIPGPGHYAGHAPDRVPPGA